MNMDSYPRDLIGYGRETPNPHWPNGAHVCVQFVVNYEEGGENNILHGDAASEAFLSEIVGASAWPGKRHMNMESIYEYGSRSGFWRLWRMFNNRNLPVTVYGVATALMRNPDAVKAMQEANWEIATHGYKWIEYKDFTEEEEWDHIQKAVEVHTKSTGEKPKGFYQGRASEHTLKLSAREGFVYSSDSYADDLPYWVNVEKKTHLIVPYTLDSNDMRFATSQGFNTGDHFFTYLKDTFDYLYEEGINGSPKMFSVGLHCRLVGRPGRAAGLAKFLDYIKDKKVWVATRLDIAKHWIEHHRPSTLKPSNCTRGLFVELFGKVCGGHLIAEKVYEAGITEIQDTAEGLLSLILSVQEKFPPTNAGNIETQEELKARLRNMLGQVNEKENIFYSL